MALIRRFLSTFSPLTACLVCLVVFVNPAWGETVIIVSVVDGDTIRIKSPSGDTELVRLIGIDSPELHHSAKFDKQLEKAHTDAEHLISLGTRAERVARSLMPSGIKVKLVDDIESRDRYGRRLSYVYLTDGTFVNRELLSRGYAHLATFPPNVAKVDDLRSAYMDARIAGRGLWNSPEFSAQAPQERPRHNKKYDLERRVRNLPAGRP